MRRALVALLTGAALTGCGLVEHASSRVPDADAQMPSQSPQPANSPTPVSAAQPDLQVIGHAAPRSTVGGGDQPALTSRTLRRALLAPEDLSTDMRQDPSFAQDTGAPRVTRGHAACRLVSEALSTSYQRGAAAIRHRGFTVGNMGPAVIEGIAAFPPGGAASALARLQAGFARCPGYRVGAGRLSNTYVVEPYRVPEVGTGRIGVALTGSFPDTPDYIQIRVAVVRVGDNLVMLCTFGILGNGIAEDEYARIIRTAAHRVATFS